MAKIITIGDLSLTAKDWAKRLGVSLDVIYRRLRDNTFVLRPDGKLNDARRLDGKFDNVGQGKRGKLYTVDGVSLTFAGWAKKAGISVCTLKMRLKRGWTLKEAVTVPHCKITHARYKGPKIEIAGISKSIRGWARALGVSRTYIDNMQADGRLQEISKMIEEAKE